MYRVHSKLLYVIDDDEDDLQMMEEIIAGIGHQARLFRSGDEMFDYIVKSPKKPDIIFLDVTMPRVDGYEILQKIRGTKKFNDVPVVIHSGNCDERCISRCFELGASFFMSKAYSVREIREALQHALDKDWSGFKTSREEFVYQNK